MSRRLFSVLSCALLLSACATVNKQPLTSQSADSIRGATIVQTARTPPDFAAMTAGKAAFAILGAAAMISEGNKIIESNKVADPASAIAEQLAAALASKHSATVVAAKTPVTADDASQIAAATRQAAKFAVDVQTINWSFGYFPTNWSRYRVIYTAKARLISTERGAVVAEGFCVQIPQSDAGAPTYDELLADGAALLKRRLEEAAAQCVKTLRSEMLSI